MKAKRAVIALAILFGGFGLMANDADARTSDGRHGKTTARSASAHHARPAANATTRNRSAHRQTATTSNRRHAARRGGGRSGAAYASGYGGGISCVPYARQVTGMTISGNGGQWWYNAAGLYARGHRPEVGSIMAFPSSGGMRAGHVAVVERIVSPREVLINHANWGGPGIRRGSIMRGVSVIDVSPNNDWTQVRVQVGHSTEAYGRVYPVSGFIHNRPEGVIRTASSSQRFEEVAEAPPAPRSRRR